MNLQEEVRAFAKEYINVPSSRTPDRKAKIRRCIRLLTGRNINFGCSTCYIEALFKILNITKMASSKYELRRGYVAIFDQGAYHGIKSFTNRNLELEPAKYEPIAEEYLRQYPARVVFFTKRPMPQKPYVPPNVKILPKEEPKPEVKEPVAEAQEQIKEALTDVLQPEAKLSGKSPRKTTRKSAKKKTDE